MCVWLIGRSFTQLIGDLNELRCKDYGDEARGAHRSVLYRPTHHSDYTMLRTDTTHYDLPTKFHSALESCQDQLTKKFSINLGET